MNVKNEKITFNSVYAGYNKTYCESNLRGEIVSLQSQIEELQVKQGVLKSFICVDDIFDKVNKEPFTTIYSVVQTKSWEKGGAVADHYGVNEERYLFYIRTDTVDFSILFEFLGEEESLRKQIYHLHAPKMSKKNMLMVEESILNQFKTEDQESVIVTHQHKKLWRFKKEYYWWKTKLKAF